MRSRHRNRTIRLAFHTDASRGLDDATQAHSEEQVQHDARSHRSDCSPAGRADAPSRQRPIRRDARYWPALPRRPATGAGATVDHGQCAGSQAAFEPGWHSGSRAAGRGRRQQPALLRTEPVIGPVLSQGGADERTRAPLPNVCTAVRPRATGLSRRRLLVPHVQRRASARRRRSLIR